MHKRIKDTSTEILQGIKSAKSILMHLHPNYDPDSIGSVLALTHAIYKIDPTISVTIIAADNTINPDYEFLPGSDLVQETEFRSVDLLQYDLFIALDASSPEQITDNETPVFPLSIPTIVIDHHKNNKEYGDINLVVPDVISTSEILYKLITEWGIFINKDMAACLFVAIWGDSGGMRWDGVTAETFNIMAQLKATGIDSAGIVYAMDGLRTRQITAIGTTLALTREMYDGRIAIVCIRYQDILDMGLPEGEESGVMGSINQFLSRSNDAIITIIIKEKVVGQVSVSFRNNNLRADKQCDVSLIASALGGGGHKRAAGARFVGKTVKEVEDLVLSKVEELHPDFGSR